METRIIDRFVIGGTSAGTSMPGAYLGRMLGSRITINIFTHELTVPTPDGLVIAAKGDEIILYNDGTLEVKKARNSNGL